MEDVLAAFSTGNHDRAFGLAQDQTRRQLLKLEDITASYFAGRRSSAFARCFFDLYA
jgi:hypothetical protein